MANINFSNEHHEKIFILNDYLLKKECKSKTFVTQAKDLNLSTKSSRPWAGGLYDPYIFQVANNCFCRKDRRTYYKDRPVKCPYCGMTVVSEDEYIENYGLFESSVPFVGFLKVEALIAEVCRLFGRMPNGLPKNLTGLWSLYLLTNDTSFPILDENGMEIGESIAFYTKEGKEVFVALADLPGSGPNDIPKVDQLGHDISVENMGLFGLKKLSELYFPDGHQCNIVGDLINNYLVVTSPGRRPLHKFLDPSGNSVITVPEETTNYYAIMTYSKELKKYMDMNISITDKATYCWFYNTMINAHFTSSELLQSSKQSLSRTIVDTRSTKSMRALITASIDLPMDTVGLPESLVYKTLQKEIINEIAERLAVSRVETEDIENAKTLYMRKDPKALKVFREMVETNDSVKDSDGNPVIPAMAIIVRNPSLHKWNLCAYKIKLVNDITIHLPIAVDEGYNARTRTRGEASYVVIHKRMTLLNCWKPLKTYVQSSVKIISM